MPKTDDAVENLSSQATTNERNSRIVNKCVETVLDACSVKDDSKPTDLYKLLDKQEKDARDQEDEDRLRRHMEHKKKGGKEDGGNSGANEENRKRKRDAEQEKEHIDIDMLL